eukprot:Gb_08492 [translate_table: standard]
MKFYSALKYSKEYCRYLDKTKQWRRRTTGSFNLIFEAFSSKLAHMGVKSNIGRQIEYDYHHGIPL